jgi:hypothetical protein
MKNLTIMLWLLVMLLAACTDKPHNATLSQELPHIAPDYIGVTIPPGIAPLNFYCTDDDAEWMDVCVSGSKGEALHANGSYADFDMGVWHELTRQHAGDSISVTVSIRHNNGQWTTYRPFAIYVSADSLGQWGLTYRLIPPGYETYGNMGIYQRCLSNFEETPILENKPIERQCMNCHTTNATNPDQLTLHLRGSHGATIVGKGGKTEILEGRNAQLGGGMVYPYWHPQGRFIAYSTNATHQRFHQRADRRVEVYDDKADIIIYDTDSHTIMADSLLTRQRRLENFPAFSPDGQWLYFCSAASTDSIWKNYRNVHYDICRVHFNADDGSTEGPIETVVAASQAGRSAVMPRMSYDGRYLLFTLADYGCFPIWHPESDLWMKDMKSGEEWPLKEANSNDADSFHNWSLNSRWVVFTSRRDNGLYTQLYLAHVDADGKTAKAFRLPQKNPAEFDRECLFSYNTPDFASRRLRLNSQELYRRILEEGRTGTTLKRR